MEVEPKIAIWPSPGSLRPGQKCDTLGFTHVGAQLAELGREGTHSDAQQPSLVDAFLDTAISEAGARSVLYISFGSYFWPPSPAQSQILLESIKRTGWRFVMVKTPAMDELSVQYIEDWISRTGRGTLVPWVNQFSLLRHKAIGGFLSHGGSNSAMEAIIQAIPGIIWPGGWDQSYVASELSTLGVGVSLQQVRTQHNVGKTTASGVYISGTPSAIEQEFDTALTKIRDDATRKRVQEVSERVKADVADGESYRAMIALGALAE